jgi:putative transposase
VALEDENAKPKKLLADAMLDRAGLKDLLAKKVGAPPTSVKLSLISKKSSSRRASAGPIH